MKRVVKALKGEESEEMKSLFEREKEDDFELWFGRSC